MSSPPPNDDLKDAIEWANRSPEEKKSPNLIASWLPIIFIIVLLGLAGWWWWANYGQKNNDYISASTTFNDLKEGAKSGNPLLVKPNGRVVSA